MFQLPQFAVAQQEAEGPVEQLADLRQRHGGADLAVPAQRIAYVAELHELSAGELLALYRRKRGLAGRGDARGARAHRALRAAPAGDLCARRRRRARGRARQRSALGARRAARRSTACRSTIKENIATRGTPVPLGTAATELTPAAADAPPAARLREAGAVILGKTTMPDYGMLSSGAVELSPADAQPVGPERNPGGSSAGAGAAAAAGYGPLHVGTDIGGSIRLPAGWCGIFTLKPSLGRIPIDPPYAGRAAGPMTRSVADAALMMRVLSRPDARDSMSLPPQDIAWSAARARPARPAHRPAARRRLGPAGRRRGARRGRRRRRACSKPPAPSSSRCDRS